MHIIMHTTQASNRSLNKYCSVDAPSRIINISYSHCQKSVLKQ
jgi:hypothetical protein